MNYTHYIFSTIGYIRPQRKKNYQSERYSTYPDYEHLKSQHIYASVRPDDQTTPDYMNTHPKRINKHTHELYVIMYFPLLRLLCFEFVLNVIFTQKEIIVIKKKERK